MMPMGYWYVATLINNIKNGLCDFEWGITALPHKEDVQAGSSFGNLTGIMINKKSEHKDLAWEYVSWLCGPEGAKVTAGCGNRPAWVSEEVAEVLASVDGFPKDENSKAALLPSMVSIEIGVSDKLAEIQTILNEEHTMIMTREISVDEGIEEMNEHVANCTSNRHPQANQASISQWAGRATKTRSSRLLSIFRKIRLKGESDHD